VRIHAALAVLLVAAMQFVFSVANGPLWLAPLAGVTAWAFWRLVDPERQARGGIMRVAGSVAIGSLLGSLPALLLGNGQTPRDIAASLVIATVTGVALQALGFRRHAAVCVLCKRPADGGAGFECPRCADRVCARPTCWNARHARCTRCYEREIVIFPIADKWWTQRLGPKVRQGECTSCGKEAREADLRECGQCHWPMCQRCWDYYNGTCRRCEWTIPDLPARLRPFVRAKSRGARNRAPDDGESSPPRAQGGYARGGGRR
jgi:hypothetical protein